MDYAQVMPEDITKLSKYYVSTEQFICTCIAMIILLILSLIVLVKQFYRTLKGYINIDYSKDYIVKIEANKTLN
jgi:hypothetical protein